jgi:Xaa-Pro dipeptidase
MNYVAYSHHRSYFSVYALQHFYLSSPIHSKYINLEVLKRYLPVGGVRIEDDILITSKGYENLTTAPKGDAMLDIIRRGRSSFNPVPIRRQCGRTHSNEDELPLLHAPGISSTKPLSILRPIARAATMPAELEQRTSVDFEPFEGPSLFSNFKRSMTTDEKIHRWQQDRETTLLSRIQSAASCQSSAVCGGNIKEVKHVYLTSGSSRPGTTQNALCERYLPACKQCTILCETLERLRQNLSMPGQSSPKSEAKVDVMSRSPKVQSRDHPNATSPAKRQPKQPMITCETRGPRERHSMVDLPGGILAMNLDDHVLQD